MKNIRYLLRKTYIDGNTSNVVSYAGRQSVAILVEEFDNKSKLCWTYGFRTPEEAYRYHAKMVKLVESKCHQPYPWKADLIEVDKETFVNPSWVKAHMQNPVIG